MTIKDKLKSYNFWITLVSAIILLLQVFGDKFHFKVDSNFIIDVTTALCSIFVVLGIISVPKSKNQTKTEILIADPNYDKICESITKDLKTQITQTMQDMKNGLFTNENLSKDNPAKEETLENKSETVLITPAQTENNSEEKSFPQDDLNSNLSPLEIKQEENQNFDNQDNDTCNPQNEVSNEDFDQVETENFTGESEQTTLCTVTQNIEDPNNHMTY